MYTNTAHIFLHNKLLYKTGHCINVTASKKVKTLYNVQENNDTRYNDTFTPNVLITFCNKK